MGEFIIAYNTFVSNLYLLNLFRTLFPSGHTIIINELSERIAMKDYSFEEHFDKYPLAMAYVPWQHFTKMYENLEKGYQAGTIFPELNKPFTGRRCVK